MANDITWMTEFTSKYHKSQRKGTTPANFVVDYISRPDATETLDPVLLNPIDKPTKVFLQQLQSDNQHLSQAIRQYSSSLSNQKWFNQQQQNLDGRAFGNVNNSYTEQQLRMEAKKVQDLYDSGHSVLKMVTSFRTPYLKERNVLATDFTHQQQGDFFGNVDELKLRQVMNNTLSHLSATSDFTNPLWMSGVQLDKDHVHCHTVLVDDVPLNQSNRLVPSSHQKSDVSYYHLEDRGELSQHQLKDAKRYCDFQFQQHQGLPFMKNNPEKLQNKFKEEQQVVDSQHLLTNAKLQNLLVTLPTDKSKWSMQNQQPDMQHANQIMHGYVEDLTTNYGHQFGYQNVQTVIQQRSQSLPRTQQASYVTQMNNQLTNHLGDYIYDNLKQADMNKLQLSTPYLRTQALDNQELRRVIQESVSGQGQLENPQLTMFNFRTQAYNQRLDTHAQQRSYYQRLTNHFDNAENVSEHAYGLRDFYKAETKYHTNVMDKYRYQLRTQGDSGMYVMLSKQVPELQRELASVRTEFTNNGQRQLVPMPKTDALLNLNSAQAVLNTAVGNQQTFGGLLSAQHQSRQTLTPKALQILSQLDKTSQLNGIYDESYQNSTNYVYENTRNSYSLNNYQSQVSTFTNQAYDAGLIDAQTWNHVQEQTIPEIPDLHLGQSVDKAQYDRVKGLDLEDCTDDLSPFDSRRVSRKVIDQHQSATDELMDGTNKALDYVEGTNQQSTELLRIVNQLAYRRKLEKYMREKYQLPNGQLDADNIDDSIKDHNLRTFDLNAASQQTHTLVQDLAQPVSDFELQTLDSNDDLELN